MEVVKNLGEDELNSLREEFEKGGDNGLCIEQFAEVLKGAAVGKNISAEDVTTERLRDLFNEIDFNGDTRVSWEEFTMFIIDAAMQGKYEGDEKIRKYMPTKASRIPVGETSKGGGFAVAAEVKTLKYFPEWNQLCKISTFGNKHRLKIIDPVTLKGIKSTPRLPHAIMSLEKIPETDILVTSSAGMEMHFWDLSNHNETDRDRFNYGDDSVEEGSLPLRKVVDLQETQLALKWCPKYNKLFSSSRNGHLNYWSPDRMEIVKTQYNVHDDAILDLLIVDQEVITASLDSTIKMMNLERNVCTGTLHGHTQGVCTLAFSQQHQFLLSAGFEYDPLVWILHIKDFHPWRLTDKQQPHHGTILGLFTVPDTPQVITADSQGMVKVWDIRTFQAVQTMVPWQQFNTNVQHARSNLFSAVTYVGKTSSLVLSGPRSTFVYRYQQTANHCCADDTPVVMALYSTVTRGIISIHKRCIKFWNETTGLIETVFNDLVVDEITAFCMCTRGRKFFLGTLMGNVQGFVLSSGCCIQELGCHKAAITSLCYGTGFRGHRFLVSISQGTPPVMINSDTEDSPPIPATAINIALQGCGATFGVMSHSNNMIIIGSTTGRLICSDSHTFALTHVIEAGSASIPSWFPVTTNTRSRQDTDRNGCESEITVIQLLGTLPAFSCGDSAGYLYVWTIRPYLYPQRLIAKWQCKASETEGEDKQIPIATALAFHQTRGNLYVGSENGSISEYDLSEAIHVSMMVQTKIVTDKNRPPKSFDTLTNITSTHSWYAHDDEINTLQIVVDINRVTIVSSGFDLKVHIWSPNGIRIASLCQGRQRERSVQYSRSNDRDPAYVSPWCFKEAPTLMEMTEDEEISKQQSYSSNDKSQTRKSTTILPSKIDNSDIKPTFITSVEDGKCPPSGSLPQLHETTNPEGISVSEPAPKSRKTSVLRSERKKQRIRMPKSTGRTGDLVTTNNNSKVNDKEELTLPLLPLSKIHINTVCRDPNSDMRADTCRIPPRKSSLSESAPLLFKRLEQNRLRYCTMPNTARLPSPRSRCRSDVNIHVDPPEYAPFPYPPKTNCRTAPYPNSPLRNITYWGSK